MGVGKGDVNIDISFYKDKELTKEGLNGRTYKAGCEVQDHGGYYMVLPTINGRANMQVARRIRRNDDDWIVPKNGRSYLPHKSPSDLIDDRFFWILNHFETSGYN